MNINCTGLNNAVLKWRESLYKSFINPGAHFLLSEEMADNGIPRVNVPQQSGEYKVVQLDIEGQPYLRFADEGWSTHAVILIGNRHRKRAHLGAESGPTRDTV